MGGMGGGGLNVNDPTVVTAFHHALLTGGLVVLGLLALLFVIWRWCRASLLRGGGEAMGPVPSSGLGEPVGRRILRIGFGLLWIFDGLLQGQASMPLGMIPQVVQPGAEASPGWVRHVVDWVTPVWTYHPVTAAASVVWIQVGVGLFLLFCARGTWSRLAGVSSVAWGAIVWVFGEAFGSIFAPGQTWLFGAPGPALIYVVGGVVVALPETPWSTPVLGRRLLRGIGVFTLAMAVLQAWPGRGFWQGQGAAGRGDGTLTGMVQDMAQTPQPRLLGSVVRAFADFDAAHGWGVNLLAVIALTLIGLGLLSGRPRVVRPAVMATVVLGAADWVLVQDLGFMGGVGTDPNSMVPLLLLVVGAYTAWVRVPGEETEQAPAGVAGTTAVGAVDDRPRRWLPTEPAYTVRIAAALVAVGVILVGAAPMAWAAAESGADPILANAISGPPSFVDNPEPEVALTDQTGHRVTLAAMRGQAVMVSFLDPVCTTDCPVIASEMRAADGLLGASAGRVRMVAVNANTELTAVAFLRAFDRQEGLDHLVNWSYLTGSSTELQAVWRAFGVDVETGVGGSMMSHTDAAFVIDPAGRVREIINTDPGPATGATRASFARAYADALESVLRR